MANIELNVVALGDFTSVTDQITKLKSQIVSLNTSLAGATGASFDKAAASVKSLSNEFSAALTNSNLFTSQTVSLQSETEKFGQSLQKGTLGLSNYYQILTKQQGSATNSVKALALEQTKLQNSVIMADPSKSGFYSVFTPKSIDAISNATKIAANEQNIYNIALRSGSNELINWGKNTQWAGRQLTVGMAIPLMVFGQQAVSAFDSVNTALTQLQKVYGEGLTPPSQNSIDQISQQVLTLGRNMAATLGISQEFTVQVASQFAAMGKQGNDLLTITQQTDRLAKLGNLDQATATNAVIALQNVYKMNTTELADAVNYFGAMQKQTSLSMSDLVQSESRIGPIIEELGGTYKDSAVMVLAMKEAGVPAAKSANALKSAMASIINPTSAATKEFASFGINLNNIKDQKGPVNMILALQEALKPLSKMQQEQLIDKLFGKYQFGNITALIQNLGTAGSQTVNALQVANATSSQLATLANQEIKQATSTPSAQWQIALQTFKADLYPLGQDIIKIGTKLLDFGNKVSKVFSGLPGPVKFLLGLLAGITVIAGPIIMLTGLMANFVGNILKGVINLKDLVTGGKSLRELLTPELIAAQNATGLFADGLKGDINEIELLTQAITDLTDKLKIMQDQMGVGAGVDQLKAAVGATAQVETSIFSQMALPGFADGGIISGPGTGTSDSILARVSNGETILTAEQTKKNAGVIADIISGRNIPGYANGEASAVEDFMQGSYTHNGKSKANVSYDAPDEMVPALSSWLKGWLSEQVTALKAENPTISDASLTKQLRALYKNAKVPVDQLSKELQGLGEEASSIAGRDVSPRELVQRSYLKQNTRADFAHVSETGSIKAGDLNTSFIQSQITDEKARQDLMTLATDPKLAGINVGLKGGLGFTQAGGLNNRMQNNHPVSVEEFNTDYMSRGVEKWNDALKNGGVKVSELSDETKADLQKWDEGIKSELQKFAETGNTEIKSSDFAEIEQKVRSTLNQTTQDMISGIDNTITEARLTTADPQAVARLQELKDQGLWNSTVPKAVVNANTGTASYAKFNAGKDGTKSYRVAGGMGSFSDEINAQKEEVKASQGIASPSEVWSEEVGKPLAQGVGKGFEETILSVGSQMHEDLLNLIPNITSITPMTEEAATEIGNAALDGITIPFKSVGAEMHADLLAAVTQMQSVSPQIDAKMSQIGRSAVASYSDAVLPGFEQTQADITAMSVANGQKLLDSIIAQEAAELDAIKEGEAAKLSSIEENALKIEAVKTEESASGGMGMMGKMGIGTGLMMGSQFVSSAGGGNNWAAKGLGSSMQLAGMALMIPGIGPWAAAAVAGVNLVYSGIKKLIDIENQHQAQAASVFSVSTAQATAYASQIKVANDYAFSLLTNVQNIPSSKNITITETSGGIVADSNGVEQYTDKDIAATAAAAKAGKTSDNVNPDTVNLLAGESGSQVVNDAVTAATTLIANGVSKTNAAGNLTLAASAAGHADLAPQIEAAILKITQGQALKTTLQTAATNEGDLALISEYSGNNPTLDLGSNKNNLNKNKQFQATMGTNVDGAIGVGTTIKASITGPMADFQASLEAVAPALTNSAASFDAIKGSWSAGNNVTLKNLANNFDKLGTNGLTFQQSLTGLRLQLNAANVSSEVSAGGISKTSKIAIEANQLLSDAQYQAAVTAGKAGAYLVSHAKQYADLLSYSANSNLPSSGPGNGADPSSTTPPLSTSPGVFTGTELEKAVQKQIQGNLDAQNAQLKMAKDQLSMQQKISQENKAQLQYQQQITGLQNDMKTAMISGNYLQAASLKQQISGARVDFNATSVEQKMQDQVDSMQSNADLINQGLQDLKDAISNNVSSLSKMPASVAQAQKLATVNAQSLAAGVATGQGATVTTIIQVTGSVTGTSTQSSHPGTKSSVQVSGSGVNSNGSKALPSKDTKWHIK
jgi:TP901 family phage tail tape measure protein